MTPTPSPAARRRGRTARGAGGSDRGRQEQWRSWDLGPLQPVMEPGPGEAPVPLHRLLLNSQRFFNFRARHPQEETKVHDHAGAFVQPLELHELVVELEEREPVGVGKVIEGNVQGRLWSRPPRFAEERRRSATSCCSASVSPAWVRRSKPDRSSPDIVAMTRPPKKRRTRVRTISTDSRRYVTERETNKATGWRKPARKPSFSGRLTGACCAKSRNLDPIHSASRTPIGVRAIGDRIHQTMIFIEEDNSNVVGAGRHLTRCRSVAFLRVFALGREYIGRQFSVANR
jgi:hypothetical protein